jgi:hypothetical protein
MLYVPRHLPNKLEYKVLSCISVHYQSRMASNGIAITPPYPLTVQAGQYEVGWGVLWKLLDVTGGGRTRLYSVFCNMFAQ